MSISKQNSLVIILAILVIFASYAAYLALPMVVVLATNLISLVSIIVILGLLIFATIRSVKWINSPSFADASVLAQLLAYLPILIWYTFMMGIIFLTT